MRHNYFNLRDENFQCVITGTVGEVRALSLTALVCTLFGQSLLPDGRVRKSQQRLLEERGNDLSFKEYQSRIMDLNHSTVPTIMEFDGIYRSKEEVDVALYALYLAQS